MNINMFVLYVPMVITCLDSNVVKYFGSSMCILAEVGETQIRICLCLTSSRGIQGGGHLPSEHVNIVEEGASCGIGWLSCSPLWLFTCEELW